MFTTQVCLLIDDDPTNQEMFARALNDVASDTIYYTSPNGYDALYMISEEAVTPSMIFIESGVRGMSCVELLKSLRKNTALNDVPIVIHAASPQPNFIFQLIDSGAQAIYYRPYNYQNVCSLLKTYVYAPDKIFFPN
jgi:CheY-like chemotaxis protein